MKWLIPDVAYCDPELLAALMLLQCEIFAETRPKCPMCDGTGQDRGGDCTRCLGAGHG
jgi:hypothetical protein